MGLGDLLYKNEEERPSLGLGDALFGEDTKNIQAGLRPPTVAKAEALPGSSEDLLDLATNPSRAFELMTGLGNAPVMPEPRTLGRTIREVAKAVPYGVVQAVRGALSPAMSVLEGGVSGREIFPVSKTLGEAAQYWKPDLGTIPNAEIVPGETGWPTLKATRADVGEIFGETMAGLGSVIAPIRAAVTAGKLVSEIPAIVKAAGPVYRDIMAGMIAGGLTGEGQVDQTLENAALFAMFEGLPHLKDIPRSVMDSNIYRKATIKERGMMLQNLDDVIRNNPDMSQGEILRRWPNLQKEAMAARNVGEGISATETGGLGDMIFKETGQPRGVLPEPVEPTLTRGEFPGRIAGENVPFSPEMARRMQIPPGLPPGQGFELNPPRHPDIEGPPYEPNVIEQGGPFYPPALPQGPPPGPPPAGLGFNVETGPPPPALSTIAGEDRLPSPAPPPLERRQNLDLRQRVDQMTPEEMQKELLIDRLTGLPNRRALEEAEPGVFKGVVDVDNLKWINDNFGHQAGDELLRTVGKALADQTDQTFAAFHISGDEFIVQGADPVDIETRLAKATEALKNVSLKYTAPDGTVHELQGIGLSYGKGADLATAEKGLQENKKAREISGERAGRAEKPARVVQIPAQGGEVGGKAKHPWEMTKNEYAGPKRFVSKTSDQASPAWVAKSWNHYTEVKKALSEGKPVPPEVLAEYPELKPKAGPAKIPPMSLKKGPGDISAEIPQEPGSGKQLYRARGLEDARQMRQEEPEGSLANYDNQSKGEWLRGQAPPKDGKLTLYRATPKGEEIKPGDYVTNSLQYAKDHIKNNLGNKGKISKIEATLDDIYPADGPGEFWYAPKNIESLPNRSTPMPEGGEFKVKPPKKLYRGEFEQEDGSFGFGTFSLGKGIYSTFTKEYAKKYGEVKELSPEQAFPRNPLVLKPHGDPRGAFTDWLLKESGYQNIREFNKKYPDPGEFVRSKGYDGVIIGDEIVKYSIKEQLPNRSTPPGEGGEVSKKPATESPTSGKTVSPEFGGTEVPKDDTTYLHAGLSPQEALKNLREHLPITKEHEVLFERLYSNPWYMAKSHPEAKPTVDVQLRRDENRRQYYTNTLRKAEPFFELKGKDLENLEKKIIEWDAQGKDISGDPAALAASGLNPQQIEAYKAVRKVLNQVNADFRTTLIDAQLVKYRSEPFYQDLKKYVHEKTEPPQKVKDDPDFQKALNALDKPIAKINELRNEMGKIKGYFPREREPGNYAVSAKDAAGNLFSYEQTKTIAGAKTLIEKHQKSGLTATFKEVTKTPESVFQGIDAISLDRFLSQAIDKIKSGGGEKAALADELQSAVLDAMVESLKARGWTKHGIERNATVIKGYKETELQDVLNQYLAGYAGWKTKYIASYEFAEELAKLNKSNPQVFDYFSKYAKDALRNSETIDQITGKIRGLAFTYFLMGNLKQVALQMSQGLTTVLPQARKIKTFPEKDLTKAMKDVVAKGGMSAEEAKMIQVAKDKGIIDDPYVQEVTARMEGGMSPAMRKAAQILNLPISGMEKYNRAYTILASYRWFRQKGQDPAQAFKSARDFVQDVHWLYGKANLPEFARGESPVTRSVGRAAYTFIPWGHNYLLSLKEGWQREGTKGKIASLESLAWMWLLAGPLAIPFLGDLMDLAEKIYHRPLRKDAINFLKDKTGTMSSFFTHGLAGLMGTDISGSMKIGLPGYSLLSGKDTDIGENLFGVFTSIGKGLGRGAKLMSEGDISRAIEEMSPTFLKNPQTAIREYTQGRSTWKGKPIFDLSGEKTKQDRITLREAITKATGFNPQRRGESNLKYQSYANMSRMTQDKADKLADRFVKYHLDKDSEGKKGVINDLRNFNKEMRDKNMPEFQIGPQFKAKIRQRMQPSKRQIRFNRESD